MKFQFDKNYGCIGGFLFQVITETMPGYWEMLGKATWFPNNWIKI